ncbi:MAG: transcription elongation factor GreB [Acidobacteriota bacterium]|nr:MAG: transcription elongation factor GreB [Acidobacteriota bacterium]
MSKAFTKESDEGPFDEVIAEPKDLLPPGAKNYVTPEGAEALRAELKQLEEVVRPQIVGAKGGSKKASSAVEGKSLSPKARLAAIDRRIQFFRERVANMVVVDPKSQDQDSVHFGATVTVADAEGNERIYKIVGVDESEPSKGRVSFISPIGNALISAREGDAVLVDLPDGTIELEVLEIEYV